MYAPLSFVVEDRVSPVAGAVTVTVAPGTADPDESVTVPEMLPVACPRRSCPPADISRHRKAVANAFLEWME